MEYGQQRLHFPRNFRCQLTNSYSVENTECHVYCFLLLIHQILYVVTKTLKSSLIMYLFQFPRTSLPGNLLECEMCSCIQQDLFFDRIAEGEK